MKERILEENIEDPMKFVSLHYRGQYFGWSFKNPSKVFPERIIKKLVHVDSEYLVFYDPESGSYSLKEIAIKDAVEFLSLHLLRIPKVLLVTGEFNVTLPLNFSLADANTWLAEVVGREATAKRWLSLEDFYVVSDEHFETYRFASLSPIDGGERSLYLLSLADNKLSRIQDFDPSGCTLFLDMHGLDREEDIAFPFKPVLSYLEQSIPIQLYVINN